MADYDVIQENGRTVIKQRRTVRKGVRSFWNGVAIAFALVVLYASIATAHWLIVPALVVVGLALGRESAMARPGRARVR